MAPPAKRAYLRLGVVGLLAGVLVLLAVLQYRWSLEVSRAERTRIEASLNTSVTQFRQEFYRELTLVSSAFHSDPSADAEDFWSAYAERYETWTRTATRPDLLANVYIYRPSTRGEGRLLKLGSGKGFEASAWPASLAALRAHMEDETRQPGEPPAGGIRAFAWTLEEGIPALVRPILEFAGGRRRGPGPPRAPLGFVILELNGTVLERMLGELAQRYFAGPDGFVYNVAVVSGGPEGKVIYGSDPRVTAASMNPPDARAVLMPASAGETRALEGMAPRGADGRKGAGRGGRNGGMRGPFGGRPRGSIILSSSSEEPWQLLARHKGGSLESVVGAERRRNLLLSFGVLLVLAVSMAMIIISTQRARRLARLQMEFVAGVSHELRTPVTVICSAADNLAEGFVGAKEQVKEYGSMIRNEGRRLAGMIEQMLEFSAGQSRRATYELGPVRVAEVVAGLLASVAPLPEGVGFTIEREIDPGLAPVEANAAALQRCLENLILNAFKYSGESRWVGIRATQAGGGARVRISVEDRGTGIDPAELPHIFEPFYRGKAGQAGHIHGAGLGLSLARDIAEGMGGRLEAWSEPGRGSIFTVELAAATAGAKPAAEVVSRTA